MIEIVSGHILVILDPHGTHLSGGYLEVLDGELGARLDLRDLDETALEAISDQLLPLNILGHFKVKIRILDINYKIYKKY